MNKELELLQFVETQLQRNQKVVLMVVVQSLGSSPGRPGFKMAVAEDGTLFGSIGGGVMEVNLVEIAKDFLNLGDNEATIKFGHPHVFTKYQDHRKDRPNSSGMICSGKQRVLFLELNSSDFESIDSISKAIIEDNQAILEINENGLRLVLPELGEFESYWQVFKGKSTFVTSSKNWFYAEKIGFKNQLFIIGGGHCAFALSELMSKLDFHITVFDDRPNLNTLQKNSFANRVEIIESYEKIGELIDSDPNAYVVVMTLGYKFDEIVIRQLFAKNFKYIGVLGSKAKMRTLLKTLEKEGFDKTKLAQIHTPIGLPINSHTPEEIAVSIAAEIIAVKNDSPLKVSKKS